MAMRWAKQPDEKGLAGVCQFPRGWELREHGRVQIAVAPIDRKCSAWYWYGHGENTSYRPVATAEEAKAQAAAHYKAVRAVSA
jgi:hypothetical protein